MAQWLSGPWADGQPASWASRALHWHAGAVSRSGPVWKDKEGDEGCSVMADEEKTYHLLALCLQPLAPSRFERGQIACSFLLVLPASPSILR
ncbi:hypothetical protein SRHO_G00264450 [Serrasalmus rhombeus]